MWRAIWDVISGWYTESHVIVWARFQMFVGVVMAVFAQTNFASLVGSGWPTRQQWILAGLFFFQGVVTEFLRRLRADDL